MSRNTGVANFDVSASGDLVYIPGNCEGGARTLVWVDRNGAAEPLPLAPKSYLHPRLPPDERRLAIEVEGPITISMSTISIAAFCQHHHRWRESLAGLVAGRKPT
jgi:hypothetical protein